MNSSAISKTPSDKIRRFIVSFHALARYAVLCYVRLRLSH
jgi:hypothetical protein